MYKKLVLGIAVALFFGCATIGPQGHYEQGLYIPTHLTECVDFCKDHDKVFTLSHPGESEDLCECTCRDGSTRQIKKDGWER